LRAPLSQNGSEICRPRFINRGRNDRRPVNRPKNGAEYSCFSARRSLPSSDRAVPSIPSSSSRANRVIAAPHSSRTRRVTCSFHAAVFADAWACSWVRPADWSCWPRTSRHRALRSSRASSAADPGLSARCACSRASSRRHPWVPIAHPQENPSYPNRFWCW